jgi:hypothetical protein
MSKRPSRYSRLNDRWERIDFETDSIAEGPPRILTLVRLTDVTHVAVDDGDWSDPATWLDGNVPGDGARARIRPGVEVTLRRRDEARLETLRVDGTFRVDPTVDTRLRVGTVVTTTGSRFEVGTGSDPVRPDVTAEIVFADTGSVTRDSDPFLVGRGLVTMGEVEMVGAETSAWHTLSRPPRKGDTSFDLSEVPTNWSAGDEIVTPGLDPYPDEGSDNEDEERVVSGTSGSTVRFDDSLDHDHVPPKSDLDTYVLNLTRNVVLRSENDALEHRGHFMMMNEQENVVKYVAMEDMGRTDKSKPVTGPLWHRGRSSTDGQDNPRARYSLHFHHTGITEKRHLVKGCVVRDDPGLGYVVHDSCADLEDNIAYRVTGTGFFTEKGTELGSFRRNFALRSWGSGEQADSRKGWSNSASTSMKSGPDNIDDWGHTGHGFWFQSPLATVEGNVAAGHRSHGFVFWLRQLHEEPLDGEVMDGKLTLRANVPRDLLDGYERAFGIDGGEPREHSKPHYLDDPSLYYNDTLPIRSFSDNEAFGCGAGVSFRSVNLRNRGPDRGAVGTGGEYGSGGESNREWSALWMEVGDFTAYNIGEHWLADGKGLGQFKNFKSSGRVGLDHRYVNALRTRDFRLIGTGGGVGIYNNRSYNQDFDVENATVENWEIGFVPGREKSSNEHVVRNVDFVDCDVDVLIPEIFGEPDTKVWIEDCSYSGDTLVEWEEIGYGRITEHAGTTLIPRRYTQEHSQVVMEDENGNLRTLYHGWSDPDFVFIEEGDTERERIVTEGKSRKYWKKVTDPDDPADVVPGATHRELYEKYGFTFYGGLLDPKEGEQRSDLIGTSPTGDGKYMRDPFFGPLKPSMPTDEIWVDPRRMTLENGASVVDANDYPELAYAFGVSNGNDLVHASTSTGDGNPPDESRDGILEYTFEVDRPGNYDVYLRCNFPRYDGVNDGWRTTMYQVDGGRWLHTDNQMGADTTLAWGKVTEDPGPVNLGRGKHTIRLTASDRRIDLFADWLLVKHETVATTPFWKGLPHTKR